MTHVIAEERSVGMMPNTYKGIFSPPFTIPLMVTSGKHALNLPTYEARNGVDWETGHSMLIKMASGGSLVMMNVTGVASRAS